MDHVVLPPPAARGNVSTGGGSNKFDTINALRQRHRLGVREARAVVEGWISLEVALAQINGGAAAS